MANIYCRAMGDCIANHSPLLYPCHIGSNPAYILVAAHAQERPGYPVAHVQQHTLPAQAA